MILMSATLHEAKGEREVHDKNHLLSQRSPCHTKRVPRYVCLLATAVRTVLLAPDALED